MHAFPRHGSTRRARGIPFGDRAVVKLSLLGKKNESNGEDGMWVKTNLLSGKAGYLWKRGVSFERVPQCKF